MNVLVVWDDGTTNVVATKDLVIVGDGQFKKNQKVNRYYEGKDYFGIITATDRNSETGSGETSDSEEDRPLIELKKKTVEDVFDAAKDKNDNQIDEKSDNDESSKLVKEKKKRFPRKCYSLKATKPISSNESDVATDFSGFDSDEDPEFVVNTCSAKKCLKYAENTCSVFLCKEMVCNKHSTCKKHIKLNVNVE